MSGTDAADWQERAREADELFGVTVENLPVNLFVCDRDGRLLYLNRQLATMVAAMCGRTPDQIVGLQGLDVWPPLIWAPLRKHMDLAIATRERQVYELAAELPDGRRMIRQWTVVPLGGPTDDVRRLLVMSYDITAERQRLTEAREADRVKGEFIAVLSHELRNPLSAITTSLYLLQQDSPDPDVAGRAMRVMDRQVGTLVRLTEDLLDVTRIARNDVILHRRALDLNDIVSQTIEDNRSRFDAADIRLETKLADGPLLGSFDGVRIGQVVTNLLSNATKFTPAGGVTVVAVSKSGAGSALLTVTDTGSGIEPELLPRVFEPFVQGDATAARSHGGLGIGLALVKRLVELHGGEVSVRSAGPLQGAEFTVRLPLDPIAEVRSRSLADEARPNAARRVLIVDDDRDQANVLQWALEQRGHVVSAAVDGREALAIVRLFRPHVVFCDIGLRGMSGHDVARTIRQEDPSRQIHLVALSGFSQGADVAASHAAGFDRHLPKPTSVEDLLGIVADSSAETG